jgi:diphosphomevalonate decarboxylase
MNKQQLVATIIGEKKNPTKQIGEAFAPANIALCKYWGKRNEQLNLPVTNSLSISLGNRGTNTRIEINTSGYDEIILNGKLVTREHKFYSNLISFLNLFRPDGICFKVITDSNIPIAAGVASSASGFAATIKALNDLFAWQLSEQKLSILARLGSGSASRSLWHGFVEWEAGKDTDGLDSFAKPLPYVWPELRIGLLLFSTEQKSISSRQAMAATVNNCPYYSLWPSRVEFAITYMKKAIIERDFVKFGQVLESNALEMHALMLATTPPIMYSNADTIAGMQAVWLARSNGVAVYFTQDAGPNLKLLFLQKDEEVIKKLFPRVELVEPWDDRCI